VDAIFKQIYRDGRFDVMPATGAPLLAGALEFDEQRLEQLQVAITQRGGA